MSRLGKGRKGGLGLIEKRSTGKKLKGGATPEKKQRRKETAILAITTTSTRGKREKKRQKVVRPFWTMKADGDRNMRNETIKNYAETDHDSVDQGGKKKKKR